MTYLVDDSGNEIVLNTEVTITKQVLSFFDFKIKGNFSTNFSIPNTSSTRSALGYYGVNQSERVAFSAQPWGLYKDGNLLTRGFLVIQGETKMELDCFFASGNASWISALAGTLKELNWSSYDQDMTIANVSTAGSTGMVWSWFDPGFKFARVENDIFIRAMKDTTEDNFVYDIYPSFYLKTILKEIAKQKEVKITGNIFDDPVFNQMVLPLPFIDRSLGDENYMTDNDTYAGYQYISGGATSTVTFAYENNSTSLTDLTNGRIQNDNRSRNVYVKIAFTFDSAFTGSVLLRKNGATIYTYNFTTASFLRYQEVNLAANDYLDVQVTNSSGFTRSITDKYFGYQLCGSWYRHGLKILAVDVIPNAKIIDIIKYVVQAFNCIANFDDFSRTITLNKIDSVRKENATDLTETVTDYMIEWQNDFAKTNYIRTKQFEDLEFFNNGELKFGEHSFDGPDNGQSQNDIFELGFGPSLVGQTLEPKTNTYLTQVPLFDLEDDGGRIAFSSIDSNGGLIRFNGLTETLKTGSLIRIVDDNGILNGIVPVESSTSTTATIIKSFANTSTGYIYKQRIRYKLNAGFRVMINYGLYSVSKISKVSVYTIVTGSSTSNASTLNLGYYYIPQSQYTFSTELRLGAHPGEINNAVSIPLADQYYNRLQRIARNPVIKAKLRLSETQFNTLDLSEFVYLDIGTWSGYFFVQKIDNYKDSITEVEAELLKVD